MADSGNLSGDGRQSRNSFIRIQELSGRIKSQQHMVSHIAENTECGTEYVQKLNTLVEESKFDHNML